MTERRRDLATRSRLEQIDAGYRAIGRRVAAGGAIVSIACGYGIWRSIDASSSAQESAEDVAMIVRTIADQRKQNTLDACRREEAKNRETVAFVVGLDRRLRLSA